MHLQQSMPGPWIPRRWPALLLGLLLGMPALADAQPRQPIGPYIVDLRGALARFKQDGAIAATVDVPAASLPTRGLGLALGAHLYPLRRGNVTLGIGGELLLARDSRTGEPPDPPSTVAPPTVTASLSAISPHLSLNFGHGEGWSYLSGGLGLGRLTTERDDVTAADAGRTRTLHYGGGARWFTGPRLAFSFDVRFYAINGREASATDPAFPRARLMVISVGASLK